MKKLLSLALCLCMVLTLVPAFTVVQAAETDEEAVENQNTLEMFGFPLDPDSYDTHALKPGTHPISPKYDLYMDDGSKFMKNESTVMKLPTAATILKPSLNQYRYSMFNTTGSTFTNKEAAPFFTTTGFAATSTGVDDHIAKVYFGYGASCGNIRLSIYDAQGNAIVTGFETGGYVATSDTLEMWEVEGLLSVTAGDFDGDGIDELAIYTPNSADKANGDIRANISVGIFDVDVKNKKVTTKQYIDLTSKTNADQICEWEYCQNGGVKQFYCLPYVALSANDLSGDGIDDLAAVVNFSTWFRGAGGTDTYSTKQLVADPISPENNANRNKTNLASVLEAYEGTKDGKLKQTIKHRVLVTNALTGGSSDSNATHRYLLRNANITVGDVTQEGSNEIIIAGNYTRVDVKDLTSTAKVGANRFVEVDGEHALCSIVGYTSYDNLKKHNTYDKSSDYHWTVQRTGNGWTYWFNEDPTDSGPITIPLCAYKLRGVGKPDYIFVNGQIFAYDTQSGTLKYSHDISSDSLYNNADGDKVETSVVWIGKAVAGNITNDMFGREVLSFPFYYKKSGKDVFYCRRVNSFELTENSKSGASIAAANSTSLVIDASSTQKVISLMHLDGGDKTSYISYNGNDTEVYYSDVEALAIMQAAPLYEELGILDGGDHIGNSATGFAKSEGSSSSTSHGGALTAGVVVGFEHETSFLGLFRVAGAEYELSITGTVSYDHETETSTEYTSGFETSGTKDAVVVFTVPYVRYNCTMYVPEYKLPTEADYNTLCAFRDELASNLEKYVNTGNPQSTGTYVNGCEYFMYKYSSYVTEDNCYDQQDVLYKVAEEIEFIEKAIASFGKGGTGEWGGTVQKAVLPYHYSVPQAPILTTVDVETYDAIAEYTPNLEKIYGNVFHEGYKAGDPNTYAHSISDLNAAGDVLQSKQSVGSSTDGFLTNSNIAAEGSAQSQSISVEKSTSDTIGWGAAIENTSLAKVGPANVGFTVTAEYNGSSTRTTTEGNEYSGSVVALPPGSPADYSYGWKLVSYTSMLNGKKVPVVGYLTKINTTPPPSVAQNIEVEDVSDNSATITWENGARPADYYKLSRVYIVNGEERKTTVKDKITSDNDKFSYTINNLTAENTSYYVLEAYTNTGKGSVATDQVIITTFPKGFDASIAIEGMDNYVIYQNGKAMTLSAKVTGNEGYDTLYQWQLDKGDGWEDLDGKNEQDFKFTISPVDNGKRVRCSAIVIISGDSSCVLYSDPAVMNCARSYGDYEVDWEGNKIIVTQSDTANPAKALVRVLDSDGKAIAIVKVDGEADLSEYLGKGYNLRLFLLDEDAAPESLPFER